MITKQKVVSKNFILDTVARIQNMFGMNLKVYEDMIEKGIKQIKEDLEAEKIELSWYRYEITQLTNGAIAIVMYGDKK